jgi:hypothetical protein
VDRAITAAGYPGKHGDRDERLWRRRPYEIVEAQWSRDGDGWANWRITLYDWLESTTYPVPIHTAGGSTSFGNPALTELTDPAGQPVLVVTLFLFSEGAAPGEAGPLLYTVPAS